MGESITTYGFNITIKASDWLIILTN
uniref:Uncharacterized protein n=1 Tax=Lepeophtheirus salmonis TaxID=72036 RepID=A0A0K2T9Q7_LEPSM